MAHERNLLVDAYPAVMGEVVSLWIKRAHGGPMDRVIEAEFVAGRGIRGNADQGGWRHVTVVDEDAWRAATRELGVDVDPSARRANVLVRGIDLEKSRGKLLQLGEVTIRLAGETRPCHLMDEAQRGLRAALGPNWRAGAYGQIVAGGRVRVGDIAELVAT
jgi:MOSC domain-containing protein YiiM